MQLVIRYITLAGSIVVRSTAPQPSLAQQAHHTAKRADGRGVQKCHLLGDLPRVGERVLEQALGAALEGAVPQRHQPQQAGHPRAGGRQAAAHHNQVRRTTCKTGPMRLLSPCSQAASAPLLDC